MRIAPCKQLAGTGDSGTVGKSFSAQGTAGELGRTTLACADFNVIAHRAAEFAHQEPVTSPP